MPAGSLFRRLFCVGIALLLSATARADNWDRFRGPNGTGITQDKNIPVKFQASDARWKVAVPGIGHASPVIWGNRLFLQSSSTDGKERWLLCYDTTDGKQLWKAGIATADPKANIYKGLSSWASSTPTTDGVGVYVAFWDGRDIIMAGYGVQGNLLWKRNLGAYFSQHGAGTSPILYKDKLIFAMDMDSKFQKTDAPVPVDHPARLYAFNKKTGETIWEIPRVPFRACYSVPSILEKPGAAPELLVTSTTAINSYDPNSGSVNWEWKWAFPKGDLRTISSTTYHDGILMATSGDGDGRRYMVAVAMNGSGKDAHPDKLWDNAKEFPYVTCLLSHKDHVYFVNDAGFAGCYHAKTGKRLWYERLEGATFNASPLLIDGKIYAASLKGDVFVLAAEPKFAPLARNSLGNEAIHATPAVANGCLYVRTEGHLFCITDKK
jgi:outer membrane protein assembly factor BamB